MLCLGVLDERRQVTFSRLLLYAGLAQPLGRVPADRLEHREALAAAADEAVLDQEHHVAAGDGRSSLPGESADEDTETTKDILRFNVGGERTVAGPGQRLVVPAGTPHKFWNAGDEVAHFVCEVRPALQFESLLETMFALAADAKTNRKGMPNPLRLAVIANAHFDTVQLPFLPAILQKVALAVGAPMGKLFGYRPTHVSAGDAALEAV